MSFQKYQQIDTECSNKQKKNNNLDILLKELSSKNLLLNNQDQYSTINSELSETNQIKNQTFNAGGYGKGPLDQFIYEKQIQESTAKINNLLFSFAFSQLKQCQPSYQKLDYSIVRIQQKQTLNCFKTPTKENIQVRTFNTSEKSYQISTGYTDNLLHDDILRKDQMSSKNFKEINYNQKDLMIEEQKLRLNSQESIIQDLKYQIKLLNDQFKQESINAISIDVQKSVVQEEIKQLEEELLLHQQDNDRLNNQISELRYQNIILSEKIKEYDKLIKNENLNQSDLLIRIKEQQRMIDEKSNKNIELQNQLLALLQSKNKDEDDTQLKDLQRQNESLKQDNSVLFQEKELSLCIIKQLEIKFDEENAKYSQNFQKQQNQFIEKEKQFLFKIQELESQLKQVQQLQSEKSLVSNSKNDQNQILKMLKQKNSRLAFKLINKFYTKKLLVPFIKIKQISQERINHRSIIKRSQSKSPVNRSANKRDLSPIREKTYNERRRLVSVATYLFKKYKKVMLRAFFPRLKQFNNLQISKDLEQKKQIGFKFMKQLQIKNCKNMIQKWVFKTKIYKFTRIIQNFQTKKYLTYSFNHILQSCEQQKNNQKTLLFCNKLANFIIKLSKQQLHVGFSSLNANRLLYNLRLNKLQIVLVKNLIKQKKDGLITYFRKWRAFTENQGVKEQAYHETESIQEKQKIFNQEIYNFLRNRIDLEKFENQIKQRQTQRSLEKVYSIKMNNTNNFESTQSFAIPQKSQEENNTQEWSFRDNKQLYQLNSNNFSLKNIKKDSYNQKNLYLNEYDLNQENMLYSNDIYKKNLSSRSCKSHISSQNSNKSQKSNKSQQRQQNGGEKSPCISYSDQLLQSNIQSKYLYTDSNKNLSLHNEGYINSSDQSVYSETVQEQRNYYK
ncbi:hypothetical protein TTHERM_00151800 (macronuclear) [Tetrahymena thermophila SB210]|uniref:Uncharacterized protein n=1 Tax=Tetrahymena thermophila (strain SB210) TaxID=312017 RepID=I7M2X2_TETTS|nr:hypothetical protein TTHERM_00151800 [Tetrahymena thermophila SB210]EAS01467.2 hypothetical protein TTHERM_00151800 [Tetrahymena thermophila SB210]|eukprot:XP_001021713.2 hypothetical protein TTHERM_00151800 [Tetrahymena thermophila SB210]